MDEKKTRVGSAFLIIEGTRILLGKRAKEPNFGMWVLPGGKIEFGEDHIMAAKREAKEELGLEIQIKGLAGKGVYYIINENEHRIIIYSIAEKVGGKLVPSSDISDARYFSKEELLNLNITPIVKQVLGDAGWIG